MDVYGDDLESGNVSHKWWDGYQCMYFRFSTEAT